MPSRRRANPAGHLPFPAAPPGPARPYRPGDAWAQLTILIAVVTVLATVFAALHHNMTIGAWIAGAGTGLAAPAAVAWAHAAAVHADGPNPWALLAATCASLTAAAAAYSAATGLHTTARLVGAAGGAACLAAVVLAIQAAARRRVLRRLTAHLSAEPGLRAPAGTSDRLVVMRRRGGWAPVRAEPRAGFIHPPPGAEARSPELLTAIRQIFLDRCGVYVTFTVDLRRDRIAFRATDPPEPAPEDPLLARLRLVTESLGRALPDPHVEIVTVADDETALAAAAVLQVFPVTEFKIKHAPTPSHGNPGVRAVITAELGQMLYGDPNSLQPTWRRHADEVVFKVRPDLPAKLPNPVLDPQQLAKRTAGELVLPLAYDEYGNLLGWQLTHTTRPHALVVGPTGGGKTVAIMGLALAAARAGVEIRGIDPKYIELRGLRGWPNVTALATGASVPAMAKIIDDTYAEMHARYAAIEAGTVAEDDFRRILLILDEYYVFVEQANAWWKENRPKGDRRSSHPVIDTVGQLAAMARGASIHLLLGVQRPDSAFFPSGARDNFRFRVALAELSPEGTRMMWERAARELPRIPADTAGRAIISSALGPVLAQVFWTPNPATFELLDEADRALVRALVPAGHTWEPPSGAAPPRPTTRRGSAAPDPTTSAASSRSPATEMLGLLRAALGKRTAHLTDAATGGPPRGAIADYGWTRGPDGHPQPAGEWIGCLTDPLGPAEEIRLYLRPDEALHAARATAVLLGRPFTAGRAAIDADLEATGSLATEPAAENRRTVRRILPGTGRVRVWDLPASLLLNAEPSGPSLLS